MADQRRSAAWSSSRIGAEARRAFPFVGDRRGVAAVEFAMILPLMLIMYIGAYDVTRGVMASRNVDLLSRAISDLVAQQSNASSMPSSTISLIFTTASAIMSPFSTNGLTLTVSAIDIMANNNNVCCQAVVRWSYTQGGTLRALNNCTTPSKQTPLIQVPSGTLLLPTNIPSSIINANQNAGYGYTSGASSYLIIADVTYTYVPLFSQAVTWFSKGMSKTTFMVPRSASGPLTLASPVNAASGQSGQVCF